MKPNEYQVAASRTLIDRIGRKIPNNEMMLLWCAIGIVGETGEIMEHIKKGVFHEHGIFVDTMRNEVGDLLWYVAAMCTKLGLNMEDVMEANIEKLIKRYPNGFSSDDSKKRVDVHE